MNTRVLVDRRFSGKGTDLAMLRKILTPRWIITTLLVITAVAVMTYLGFWQLDRLEQRRAFNTRVTAQLQTPPLDLSTSLPQNIQSLYDMEYRQATAQGEYDFANEILLRNQVWDGQPGYHLFTPLHLPGSAYAVLVDRGFIPLDEGKPALRTKYDQPAGIVKVSGIFLRPRVPRYFGVPDPPLAPGETRLDAWNAIRLERIQEQVGYSLLPVFIQSAPDPSRQGPPFASLEQPDLSEGPHMGYALQWFSFAAVLAFGYPFFVRKQFTDNARNQILKDHKWVKHQSTDDF
ncbi:MAG: SURF1 family protein [Anaerolineaceae bacterium]|nr:SURF1 family protein [Anaerolineaceae bacterium]